MFHISLTHSLRNHICLPVLKYHQSWVTCCVNPGILRLIIHNLRKFVKRHTGSTYENDKSRSHIKSPWWRVTVTYKCHKLDAGPANLCRCMSPSKGIQFSPFAGGLLMNWGLSYMLCFWLISLTLVGRQWMKKEAIDLLVARHNKKQKTKPVLH